MIPFRMIPSSFALLMAAMALQSDETKDVAAPDPGPRPGAPRPRYICEACGRGIRMGSDVRCRCGHVGKSRRNDKARSVAEPVPFTPAADGARVTK